MEQCTRATPKTVSQTVSGVRRFSSLWNVGLFRRAVKGAVIQVVRPGGDPHQMLRSATGRDCRATGVVRVSPRMYREKRREGMTAMRGWTAMPLVGVLAGLSGMSRAEPAADLSPIVVTATR